MGIQRTLDRFAAAGLAQTPAGRSIGVTSFKSLVGHTKAAAGVGGLIKAICAVNQRVVPPTAGCVEPSPVFAAGAESLYPVLEGEVHPADAVLRAGVSAMGFGGINSHVTLESADAPSDKLRSGLDDAALLASAQDSEVFLFTGDSWTAVRTQLIEAKAVAAGLAVCEATDFSAHLARDAKAGSHRAAIVSGSIETLQHDLDALLTRLEEAPDDTASLWCSKDRRLWTAVHHPEMPAPRIAFVYPGQGSQIVHCGRILLQRYGWARTLLRDADMWLAEVGGPSLSALLYPEQAPLADEAEQKAQAHKLSAPACTEPVVIFSCVLWTRYLRDELDVQPELAAGHSLGELAALYCAGALDERAVLQLAAIRGQAMARCSSGAMAGLGCSSAQAEALIAEVDGYLTIANRNSPKQAVVSGAAEAVDALLKRARKARIAGRKLAVSGAFHSKFVEPAGQAVAADSRIPAQATLQLPVLSSVAGVGTLQGNLTLRAHVGRQIYAPVDFLRVTEALADKVDLILEAGPGRVLSGLVADTLQGAGAPMCLPLETRSGRSWEHSHVLAALAVLGAGDVLSRSLASRLTRPFVPAQARRFIENPCEMQQGELDHHADVAQPDASVAPVAALVAPTTASDVLLQSDALSHLEADLRASYLAERGEFLQHLQGVLNSDVEHFLWRQNAPQGATQVAVMPLAATGAATGTGMGMGMGMMLPPASNTAHALGRLSVREQEGPAASVSDTLLHLVAEKTGFPTSSLALNMHLLDDLRLDSIKSAELIVDACQVVAADSTAIDPTAFANASLQEISDLLSAALQPAAPQAGTHPASSVRALSQAPSSLVPGPIHNFIPRWDTESAALPRIAGGEARWSQRTVLLCTDDSSLAQALAASLSAAGATLHTHRWGDPILQSAVAQGVSDIIALFPTFDESKIDIAMPMLGASLAELGRLAASDSRDALRITWLQSLSTGLAPDARAWSGDAFISSLYLERRHLHVRVLLTDASHDTDTLLQHLSHEHDVGVGSAAADARQPAAPHFERIWIDASGTRRVLRLAPHPAHSYRPRALSLGPEDVVLITGGAKGITAECALTLGAESGARLALVGSSPAAKVEDSLARFQAAGIRAHYFRCDLSQPKAVHALVDEVRQRLGPVTALVHGAGLNRPRLLGDTTVAEGLSEMAPKLVGGAALLDALDAEPPKVVVMFSSIIGVLGMMGNTWYALANECLDLRLGQFLRSHPEVAGVSLAYTVWEGTGMGVELGALDSLRAMGVDTLSIEEGVQRFMQCLNADPEARQIVISGRMANIDTWRPSAMPSAVPSGNFHVTPLVDVPGIEAEREYSLDFARDGFLHDHVFQGSPLLATTMVMEMMAQTAAAVLNAPLSMPLEITDLRFAQPVTVPQNGTRRVRLRAVIAQPSLAHDDLGSPSTVSWAQPRVQLELRSDADDFAKVWASATLDPNPDLSQTPAAPSAALPTALSGWDPVARGIYDSLLFHGPAFQRIASVDHVAPGEACCTVRVQAEPDSVLGDGYARDAFLQSMQFGLAPQRALPQRVLSWRVHRTLGPEENQVQVHSTMQPQEGRKVEIQSRVTTPSGELIEALRWEATLVAAAANEQTVSLPSVHELAAGWSLEAAQITAMLRPVCDDLALPAPHLRSQRLPHVHDLPQAERHAQHRRFLRQMLGANTAVHWDEAGRPELSGHADFHHLSITHTDDLCVYLLADAPVGIDLMPIEGRTVRQWTALLPPATRPLYSQTLQAAPVNANALGCALWAAHEAATKALGQHQAVALEDLQLRQLGEVAGSVEACAAGLRCTVVFGTVRMRGQRWVCACVLRSQGERRSGIWLRDSAPAGTHRLHPLPPQQKAQAETATHSNPFRLVVRA
ncbi:MAG: SDR family NAD(P)-dependent oxidoreductase [Polyangiales bacterium]